VSAEWHRPLTPEESLRATRRSRGDGTIAGRARIAQPPGPPRPSRRPGTIIVRSSPGDGAFGSSGYTINLRTSLQVVSANDPTVLVWTDENGPRQGFPTPSVPLSEITIPAGFDGVGSTSVTVAFDPYVPAETEVVVYLNGVPVTPLFGEAWVARQPMVQMGGLVPGQVYEPGQLWSVEVTTPPGADDVDVRASINIKREGPKVGRATDLLPPPPLSALVAGSSIQSSTAEHRIATAVPAGTAVGDLLVYTYTGFDYNIGTAGTLSVPAGVTVRHAWPGIAVSSRAHHVVATRVATADDVNGAVSHQWGPVRGDGNTYHGVSVAAFTGVDTVHDVEESSGALVSPATVSPPVGSRNFIVVGCTTYHGAGGLLTPPSAPSFGGDAIEAARFSGSNRPSGEHLYGGMAAGGTAQMVWTDGSSPATNQRASLVTLEVS
jgi:hypothetical protein